MGLCVLRGLLSEIRNARYYSIIADEATDVGHKEQLVVCIRWVDDNFDIHEDTIQLINVPKTDAQTLTTCIKDCLLRCCLPMSQCRSQAYDGAGNMSGYLNGVAAKIQNDVPSALYVHCLAHCTNLCLQTIGRQCQPVRDALDLARSVADLIRYSPKRSSLFQALQAQLPPGSDRSPSLKPLCPTRWTVRTSALHSILNNYCVLCETLQKVNAECHDEYGRTAGGYLAQMEEFSTYLGLKMSHLIFGAGEQLSISLQGKDTTLQEATTAADLAVCHLERLRTDEKFHSFYEDVVKCSKNLTAPPCLPRYRRPQQRLDEAGLTSHECSSPECYFKQQYFEVLDLLVNELKRRFQQKRGMPVAATIEKLLLDAVNGTYTMDGTALPEELQLYKDDLDLSRLKYQLSMLPDVVQVRNRKLENNPPITEVTNVRTICSIMADISLCKEMLSEVVHLIKLFYIIPVTTSTAERTFSALRRLKTYLRTTMSQERLNHAMSLYVHKDRTDNIDLDQIANSFITVNERRRNFFGHV
ncbi:zinc finger MYM-type protein 1-like [Corticium candelabrum]|uniref:zinc finger MYM-type protein 1-like n=1 Tax=Corticium candelabrum TaxID=121492 RepID=UPI002E26242F|nr:zinc finger MYM-type protein 1-like [Corticium candelabrum]